MNIRRSPTKSDGEDCQQSQSTAGPAKVFPCPAPGCGKVFTRRFNLQSHELVHSDIRPFKCDLCSGTFRRKFDLRRHMRSLHTGSKPYTCELCGLGFTRSDTLRRHRELEALRGREQSYQASTETMQIMEGNRREGSTGTDTGTSTASGAHGSDDGYSETSEGASISEARHQPPHLSVPTFYEPHRSNRDNPSHFQAQQPFRTFPPSPDMQQQLPNIKSLLDHLPSPRAPHASFPNPRLQLPPPRPSSDPLLHNPHGCKDLACYHLSSPTSNPTASWHQPDRLVNTAWTSAATSSSHAAPTTSGHAPRYHQSGSLWR